MPPDGYGAEVSPLAAALAVANAPEFLRKLDRLRLRVRHSLSTRPGNTPMPRGAQGYGLELESHKTYAAGDDLRHLDWNAYGRLDQLLIKTFRAEREAPLHVFVDTSASMHFPPADNKIGFAAALAACLTYVSVRNHDPARIVALGGTLPAGFVASPFVRHRTGLERLRDFLLELRPAGDTALADGIAAALRGRGTPGVAVVVSDFLVPAPLYESALGLLAGRRFTVAAVRVLGPGERDPVRLFRRAELVDAETGARRFVTLGPANLTRYQAALRDHLGGLEAFCRRSGVMLAVVDPAAGIDRALFEDLPGLGLVH
ncbi:DUF58 domain-containing protein [Candidatus Binatia bacterium]|nr:DUF58 domain-containing protein [Candidatus Binatia bacterium]